MRIVNAILSIFYYTYFFLLSLLCCIPVSLVLLLPIPGARKKYIAHSLTRVVGYHLVRVSPWWRVQFINANYLNPDETYVVVANHQSFADVLVLSGLQHFYKWIAKAQIFRFLGVGQLLLLNGHVCVAHGSIRSVRRMMRKARQLLCEGVSIFVFPEGTRSVDGDLICFKEGPFRLACEAGVRVIPVVIHGTRDILPTGEWILNFDARVLVKALPPVDPADFDRNSHALCAFVRSEIKAELQRLQADTKQPELAWETTL